MTAEQEYLRSSLRANLLATLAANRRHEDGGIRLFEMGKVYLAAGNGLPQEPEMLCGIMSGSRVERSWLGGDRHFRFLRCQGGGGGAFTTVWVSRSALKKATTPDCTPPGRRR